MEKPYNSVKAIWLLGVLVFLSRLPFLNAGYGTEEDSWGLALTAHNIHQSGSYEYSRLPGHPFQEIVLALLWGAGPFVFNSLSAVFSALAAVFCGLAMKRSGFKEPLAAAAAFAFIPVVYISSTYTIDYMWAMAFIMMAWYLVLGGKMMPAGIALGLAIGCRITSGALLLPFLMMIWQQGKEKKKRAIWFSISALTTALICFSPLIAKYGLAFFNHYDQLYPPFAKVIYKASFGVFGTAGLAVLLFAIVLAFRNRIRAGRELFPEIPARPLLFSWVAVVLLYVIAYLRLPEKSAFLIPALPFLILILGYLLSRKSFLFTCFFLVISSFFFSINLSDPIRGAAHSSAAFKTTIAGQEIFFDPLNGPVLSEYSKRENKLKYTDAMIACADTMKGQNVIIAGWWYNEIMLTLTERGRGTGAALVFYASPEELGEFLHKGCRLYYLPEQDRFNDLRSGISFTSSMASAFPLSIFKEN